MPAVYKELLPDYAATRRYRVDLTGFMRTCDQNYFRLLQLVPHLPVSAAGDSFEFAIRQGPLRVRMTVIEAFRYTTVIKVSSQYGFPGLHLALRAPVIEVRLYHDARTAEPVSFQEHRKIPVRASLPNAEMYHQDEKHQINEFLAEWLQLCLVSGCEVDSPFSLCSD
jgi:uncharacterized protein YqiB (DUF1249 family)